MDSFFGIGLFELFLIAVIALVVLGPERLPGAMRTIAEYMRQIRNIGSEFTSQFSEEIKMLEEMDPRRMINDVLDPAKTPAPAKPAQPAKPLASNSSTAAKRTTTAAAGAAGTAAAKAAAQPGAEGENTILPPNPDVAAPAVDANPPAVEPEPASPELLSPTDGDEPKGSSSAEAEASR